MKREHNRQRNYAEPCPLHVCRGSVTCSTPRHPNPSRESHRAGLSFFSQPARRALLLNLGTALMLALSGASARGQGQPKPQMAEDVFKDVTGLKRIFVPE